MTRQPALLHKRGIDTLYRKKMNFETAYFDTGYNCPDRRIPMRIQRPKNPAMT